jgi:hypothetical protein
MAKKRAITKRNAPAGGANPQWSQWMAMRNLLNTVGTQDRRALLTSWLNRDIDMNFECRWPTEIEPYEYKQLFERHGVAQRVVTIWPEECWILPPEIYESEDAKKETPFEAAWKALEKNLHLTSYLKRVDILSRIGRYGGLLFGLSDLGAGGKLSDPVKGVEEAFLAQMNGKPIKPMNYKLLFLKAFQEADITISERETRPNHPRYTLPTKYTVTMENPSGSSTSSATVHWTRMLHVADNRLSSEVFGEPAMKPVWNDLIDVRKIKGGGAEGYWRACLSGIMWGLNEKLVDPSVNLTPDQKEEFQEDLQKYHNGMQRDLISMGLVPHDIAPKLVDPTPFVKCQIDLICIQLGIPISIFMGREEGQLAADENRDSWLERVKGRQNNYLTPMLVQPFVERLQVYGALPVTKEEVQIAWPERDVPSEGDIADTAVKTTTALAQYQQGDVSGLMGEKEYFGQVLKKTPEEIDAIAKEVGNWEANNNPPEDTAESNPAVPDNKPE